MIQERIGKMMISVEVNKCNQCRHRDHSGSYTLRGARPICGHSDACKARKTIEEFGEEYPEYVHGKLRQRFDFKDWKYHWYNRIIENPEKTIPDWCPLKHGSCY